MNWNYHVELLKGTTHQVRAVMDQLGKDGWELVSIIGSVAYFKRPCAAEIQPTIQPRNGKDVRARA